MVRYPWAKPMLFGKEAHYVSDAINSSWISGGAYVERFEREVPEILGTKWGISVSNGTAALHLALLGLGIGPGDEVIVPAFTFVAAANMVLAVGASPIYADVDSDTWLLDPKSCKSQITSKTKAIIAVHLYGNVSNMDAIIALGRDHGLAIIEDNAEAFGARFRDRYAGTFGTIGTLSFQATKTVTTGEGGMVLCDDDVLANSMRRIRDHGMVPERRYWHDRIGYNFRLTNTAAAMGCAQLEFLDQILAHRSRLHNVYRRQLDDIPGLRLQKFDEMVEPVLWALALQFTDVALIENRGAIMADLAEIGIETRPGFYDLSQLPPYDCPVLPNAVAISRSVLSLPTYNDLTDSDVMDICAGFFGVLDKYR